MRISEVAEHAAERVRLVKQAHVRRVKGKPDRTDVPTFIEFYRGEDPVALCTCQPHRDVMLDLIRVGVVGFSADTVCWTNEGWYASRELAGTNPVTGKSWEPNEMEDVARNHGGIDKGWVFEALVTTVANRAGDMLMVNQPYRIQGRSVDWQERLRSDDGGGWSLGGYVPDTVREAMQQPDLYEQVTKDMPQAERLGVFSMTYEERMFHQDVGMVRAVEMRAPDYPVGVTVSLYARPGSVRHQKLRERFPRAQVIDPRHPDV